MHLIRKNIDHVTWSKFDLQVALTSHFEMDLTNSFYVLWPFNNEWHFFHCCPPLHSSHCSCEWKPCWKPSHTVQLTCGPRAAAHTHIFTCARTFHCVLLHILWGKKLCKKLNLPSKLISWGLSGERSMSQNCALNLTVFLQWCESWNWLKSKTNEKILSPQFLALSCTPLQCEAPWSPQAKV